MPKQNWKHLAPRQNSAYRQLFIKGTRIRAEAVYALTVDGTEPMTAEDVAADLGLPLEAVREAIAYCETCPPELREDHEREQARRDATGMSNPAYDGLPRLLTASEIAQIESGGFTSRKR